MPRCKNALLRRYSHELERLTAAQIVILIVLGFPCLVLIGGHLRDLGERWRTPAQVRPEEPAPYRPGVDFYEAERRARERGE